MPAPIHENFWAHVNVGSPEQCWEWKRAKRTHGYGGFWKDGTIAYAHRHAYELVNGPIPTGMHICHTCDNPSCCNPAHLWVGTAQDNALDKVSKGRHVSPSPEFFRALMIKRRQHGFKGSAKLTESAVADIRQRRANGETLRSIASDYNIDQSHVSLIARNLRWS